MKPAIEELKLEPEGPDYTTYFSFTWRNLLAIYLEKSKVGFGEGPFFLVLFLFFLLPGAYEEAKRKVPSTEPPLFTLNIAWRTGQLGLSLHPPAPSCVHA